MRKNQLHKRLEAYKVLEWKKRRSVVVGRRETRRRTASTRWAELEEKEEFRKRCYEVEKEEQHEELQEKSDLSFDLMLHVAGNAKAAAGNAKAGAPLPSTNSLFKA